MNSYLFSYTSSQQTYHLFYSLLIKSLEKFEFQPKLQMVKYCHTVQRSGIMFPSCRVSISASPMGAWASLMMGCDCGFWGVSGMGAISPRCSTEAWWWEEKGHVTTFSWPLADKRGQGGERKRRRRIRGGWILRVHGNSLSSPPSSSGTSPALWR